MKKIIVIMILIILNTSLLTSAQLDKFIITNLDDKWDNKLLSYKIEIDFPQELEYNIVETNNGHVIRVNDYGFLSVQGKPLLPGKNFIIALPENAEFYDLDIQGIGKTRLNGCFNVKPSDIIIPFTHEFDNHYFINDIQKEWINNHESIYLSNKKYPEKICIDVNYGLFRKYPYVSVFLCPLEYYPNNSSLYYYDSAKIIIYYTISELLKQENQINSECTNSNAINNRESRLFYNYNEINNKNGMKINHKEQEIYDYLIITSSDLRNAIMSSKFVDWKESIGYNVKIINISDNEISEQLGRDKTEKIRNFLREYYLNWSIKYVLLVGDYSTVPMRYCYPNPYNHWNNTGIPSIYSGEVPTDFYYADLSFSDDLSWDFDGDGFYGEYGEDRPDLIADVFVGRIPTSNPDRVVYTLDKIVNFEQDTDEWKDNALHAGAIAYYANLDYSGRERIDLADCLNSVETDFMYGWNVSKYCEKEGLAPSIYDWNALTRSSFSNDWYDGKYAVVNWGGHGLPDSVWGVIWDWDDGDGVPESEEMDWYTFLTIESVLNDEYPSIVFALSCMVGYPEENSYGNIGIDLLTNPFYGAAVGVVSSYRYSWVSRSSGENLLYEFNHYMIDGPFGSEPIGDALFDAKLSFINDYYDDFYSQYWNLFSFNLYGDPSLRREGVYVGVNPDKPSMPSGPTNIKIGVKYEYKSYTFDPDNDNIYYLWDWGDGTTSEWLGPYESGKECIVSHIWSEKGEYEIKVKAKDTYDLESDWSEPLVVSMPKNKYISQFLKFIFDLLEYNSCLFSILRQILGL